MVLYKDGISCNCGRKGCFEKYASMSALKREICKELGLENINGEQLKNILEDETNPKINKIVDCYIEDLSVGIANIINIFEPEVISIGGSFTYYQDTLFKKLKDRISMEELFNKNNPPKIVLAKLKNDAGIIGATFN